MKRMGKKWQGFTLVELLIVVAIIGILSTIGIPTFKRMVQKTKKSEAKVGLGGLYTAEAAFYSEYGAYGNNIFRIGFELDGADASRIYTLGFPTGACASMAIAPAATTAFGQAITAAFPAYYATDRFQTHYLRTSQTACQSATIGANGSSFIATATGAIAPGVLPTAALTAMDIWTMNDSRELSNTQDGVQ